MSNQDDTYILDSSFFLSAFQPPDGKLITTEKVIQEIHPERKELGFARTKGLRILAPSNSSLEKVNHHAKITGDLSRLSVTDIELLALARELNGILVTDDYSMQNVAETMKIPYRTINQKGITKIEKWYFRCSYCGRYYQEKPSDCPTCGGPIRTTRKPPKK